MLDRHRVDFAYLSRNLRHAAEPPQRQMQNQPKVRIELLVQRMPAPAELFGPIGLVRRRSSANLPPWPALKAILCNSG